MDLRKMTGFGHLQNEDDSGYSLKCHYDQILDIHFFIFSDTIGLS